jgi:hypothetical protein
MADAESNTESQQKPDRRPKNHPPCETILQVIGDLFQPFALPGASDKPEAHLNFAIESSTNFAGSTFLNPITEESGGTNWIGVVESLLLET